MNEPREPDPTTPAVPRSSPKGALLGRRVVGPFILAEVLSVLVSVVFAALILLFLTSPLAQRSPASPSAPGASFYLVGAAQAGLQIGAPAPELIGTVDGQTVELSDLDGKPVRLADYRGRPVWINFWATWCPPCQEETPVLRDVYTEFSGRGLALIAISVQETSVDDVRAYVARYGLNYTVAFDVTSAVFHTYQAFGLPTHVFVDRDGIVRDVILGPLTRERAEQEINQLLNPASP